MLSAGINVRLVPLAVTRPLTQVKAAEILVLFDGWGLAHGSAMFGVTAHEKSICLH